MGNTRKTSKVNEETSTWTHTKILKLIRLYKQNEHLWNANSQLFRLTKPRNITWELISKELKVSVPEIALKIQSLRRACKRNWKKSQLTGAERDVKWPYYAPLKFLVKSFVDKPAGHQKRKKNEKRHSPLQKPEVNPESIAAPLNSTNVSDADSEPFTGFSSPINNNTIPISDRDNRDDDSDSSVYLKCISREQKFPMPKIERGGMVSTSAQFERLPQTNGDRIDGFFKSMADTVKTFPPRIVAEIKLNISNMIGQIELQLISGEDAPIVNN